jgi:hypothetical protein
VNKINEIRMVKIEKIIDEAKDIKSSFSATVQ